MHADIHGPSIIAACHWLADHLAAHPHDIMAEHTRGGAYTQREREQSSLPDPCEYDLGLPTAQQIVDHAPRADSWTVSSPLDAALQGAQNWAEATLTRIYLEAGERQTVVEDVCCWIADGMGCAVNEDVLLAALTDGTEPEVDPGSLTIRYCRPGLVVLCDITKEALAEADEREDYSDLVTDACQIRTIDYAGYGAAHSA